jgi:prevent-host-death family protein
MKTVTHREMRNQSGEILRAVASGDTIQVTNAGTVAAFIVPPGSDTLAELIVRGQARAAKSPLSSLRQIKRTKSKRMSEEIIADSRGRW